MYGHKIQLFKFTQCSRPVCHTEYGDDKLTYLLKDIWVFFKFQHTAHETRLYYRCCFLWAST